ncbi:MAG: DNA-directed RNA polymerase subunit P [Methanobrevibacter sp.]|nr:DNA-directed RNA polymerase subunit P [Candidatus Methanoflexus mossambicus]
MYTCPNCGKEIDLKKYMENKCPVCRYRILFKEVPENKKEFKAR